MNLPKSPHCFPWAGSISEQLSHRPAVNSITLYLASFLGRARFSQPPHLVSEAHSHSRLCGRLGLSHFLSSLRTGLPSGCPKVRLALPTSPFPLEKVPQSQCRLGSEGQWEGAVWFSWGFGSLLQAPLGFREAVVEGDFEKMGQAEFPWRLVTVMSMSQRRMGLFFFLSPRATSSHPGVNP